MKEGPKEEIAGEKQANSDSRFFGVIATVKPDWYFEDRHTTDIPGLMRKVQETLDSPEMEKEFSFQR